MKFISKDFRELKEALNLIFATFLHEQTGRVK